jgi:hypothetical protein
MSIFGGHCADGCAFWGFEEKPTLSCLLLALLFNKRFRFNKLFCNGFF